MHLLSGKTLEARRAQRPQTIIQNGSGGFAMEFNGTDEYLQIALPSDLASFTPSTISAGSAPTGWTKLGSPTITYETTESGSSGCMKVVGIGGIWKNASLTTGKKYKIALRYKSTGDVYFGHNGSSTGYGAKGFATSEWNTITFIITAVDAFIFIRSTTSITYFIESITIKEDQGFDLNKDQEQILHSKNSAMEQTFGAELATGALTLGTKYIVTAGTVQGNAIGTEFMTTTDEYELNASNKVRSIPNLVANNIYDSDALGWTLGTGWTLSEGSMIHTAGVASSLAQGIPAIINPRKFRTVFTVSNMTTGSVNIQLSGGGGGNGTARTADGTYTQDIVAGSTSQGSLYVVGSADFDGTISNIHIYEIFDWASTGNHTGSLSILDKSGTGSGSLLISASGAGRGAELVTNPTIAGSATGWTITNPAIVAYGNDNLICTNLNNSSTLKPTGVTVTAGKRYEVIFTITATAGNIAFVAGVGATGRTNKTVSGTYRELQTCINTGDFYIDGSGFYGTIESLYVKEYLGEVTLPSANIESVVSGKKYTLEGFVKCDPASLTYGANLLTGDNSTFDSGIGTWLFGAGTFTSSGGYGVISTANTQTYIYRTVTSANKFLKVTFKAKSDTYVGRLGVYHNQANVPYITHTGNITSSWQTFTMYINSWPTAAQTFYIQVESSGHTGDIHIDDISIQEADMVNITAQIGTKSVTTSTLTGGSYTKAVLNFEATSAEVGQDLKLYLNGVGSVFVDAISLTQAYDVALLLSKKGVSANTDWLFAFGAGSTGNIGYDMYQGSTGVPTFALRTSTTQTSTVSLTGTANQIWVDLIGVIDRAGATLSYIKSNKLSQNTTFDTTDEGKVILHRQLIIGSYWNGGTDSFAGQISHIQIIRFENISQSTFNSAITGLQYPTGGGAEEVLRLTFSDGSTINNTLKDYSAVNHTITGVNIDSTNRKRVN
jgi:hypothetical protein